MEHEREGNSRWWEEEGEPGCPSVTLIHAYALFPSGLLQWFILQQSQILHQLSAPMLNFM